MDILNDWYESHLGVRPGDDNPDMTEAELQMLCEIIGEIVKDKPTAANDNVKGTNR